MLNFFKAFCTRFDLIFIADSCCAMSLSKRNSKLIGFKVDSITFPVEVFRYWLTF